MKLLLTTILFVSYHSAAIAGGFSGPLLTIEDYQRSANVWYGGKFFEWTPRLGGQRAVRPRIYVRKHGFLKHPKVHVKRIRHAH
jgi:hypothetical protein